MRIFSRCPVSTLASGGTRSEAHLEVDRSGRGGNHAAAVQHVGYPCCHGPAFISTRAVRSYETLLPRSSFRAASYAGDRLALVSVRRPTRVSFRPGSQRPCGALDGGANIG